MTTDEIFMDTLRDQIATVIENRGFEVEIEGTGCNCGCTPNDIHYVDYSDGVEIADEVIEGLMKELKIKLS